MSEAQDPSGEVREAIQGHGRYIQVQEPSRGNGTVGRSQYGEVTEVTVGAREGVVCAGNSS